MLEIEKGDVFWYNGLVLEEGRSLRFNRRGKSRQQKAGCPAQAGTRTPRQARGDLSEAEGQALVQSHRNDVGPET